jgi:PBP1b-binding outer membrane lipoprotein LpoB
MNKNVLGVISVLVLVVMVSGCSSTMGNYQQDLNITVSKATVYPSNNSATIIGKIINNGSTAYSDINVEVLGLDKNKKPVYNKTETINYVAPNQSTGFIFAIPPQKITLTNYKVTIENATATATK